MIRRQNDSACSSVIEVINIRGHFCFLVFFKFYLVCKEQKGCTWSRKTEVAEREERRTPESRFLQFYTFVQDWPLSHRVASISVIYRCTAIVDVNSEFPEEKNIMKQEKVNENGLMAVYKCSFCILCSYQYTLL